MNRRLFLLGLTASAGLLVTSGAVFAASFSEDVVAQLVRLGFSDITAETTLLGRIRILARRGDGVREIVLNPRTGEVLRDTWLPFAGGASAPRTVISDVDDGNDTSAGNGSTGDDSSGNGDDSGSNGDDSSGNGDDSGGNSGPGGGNDDSDDDRDDRNDDRDDRDDDRDDGNND